MKNFFRLFIFILAFQMEVRVRASGDVLEQPKACLKSKETCALQATTAGFHLLNEDFKIHATGRSALVRLSDVEWRLVKGALWVEKGPGMKVETLYGDAQATSGQYWLIEQGDKVVVRNIDAELFVTLRDGKKLQVPEGFEFWISGINSKGKSDFGMIQPIVLAEHLPLWNGLYRGNKESFIKEVGDLRESWGDLTAQSSAVYRGVVDRKIAVEKSREAEIAKRQAQQEARTQEMKKLYHQKVFER